MQLNNFSWHTDSFSSRLNLRRLLLDFSVTLDPFKFITSSSASFQKHNSSQLVPVKPVSLNEQGDKDDFISSFLWRTKVYSRSTESVAFNHIFSVIMWPNYLTAVTPVSDEGHEMWSKAPGYLGTDWTFTLAPVCLSPFLSSISSFDILSWVCSSFIPSVAMVTIVFIHLI